MKNETHVLDLGSYGTVKVLLDFDTYEKTKDPADIMCFLKRAPPLSRQAMDRYLAWMHDLNKRIARSIEGPYLYVLALRGKPLAFLYHPDGTMQEAPLPPPGQD